MVKSFKAFNAIDLKYAEFDAHEWLELLREYPQYAEHCDLSVFDSSDLYDLLTEHPQMADNLEDRDIEKLTLWDKMCLWNKGISLCRY